MTTMTETGVTTQVYRVFIKATPEAIWDAITNPEFNQRYGYRGRSDYDLRPGGAFRAVATPEMVELGMPEQLLDGEVVEADPPRRLVQTWRVLWDPAMTAEGFTRLTWEIEPGDAGITTLTVTHELEGAPKVATQVSGQVPEAGGGWSWILSDLKTLLETGASLAD
jgi:uncharacterized protein YndB with AHSA1/START domain